MSAVVQTPLGLDEHRAMDKRGLETFTRLEAQWKGTLTWPEVGLGSGATTINGTILTNNWNMFKQKSNLNRFVDFTDLTNQNRPHRIRFATETVFSTDPCIL